MKLKFETRIVDDILIVKLKEPAVLHDIAPYLKEQFFIFVSQGHQNIILDMEAVQKMDSSGLSALLFGKRQANTRGGDLFLIRVNEPVLKILQIAQFTRVFDIYDSEEEALAAFK